MLIEKGLTPHILFLDETNWFTYIENGEDLPKKCNNNKQYHYYNNQLAIGLAVSEGAIPFMHEAYEGNKHDAKAFPRLLDVLTKRLTNLKINTENLTMVIDKGNNSQENIEDLVSKMHIVASAKHNQA
ncbi:MAG TPA: hypothetical protein C5S51_09005 [Methanosarcinaceae archaeon]|nr:hypothetical protein [Methanosarcinaceae archaeon]